MSWLCLLVAGYRVGIYCSDVSGAFDRVSAKRLLARLRSNGVHPRFLRLFESWLSSRTARVNVAGASSPEFTMSDMVYQGTVWGPPLWNVFVADASNVLKALLFEEIFYADDLNAFKGYTGDISDDLILSELRLAQAQLHL